METLDQYDFLGAFSAALETTGLAQRLSPTRTPVTLFAPTNQVSRCAACVVIMDVFGYLLAWQYQSSFICRTLQAFASLAEQLGMDGEDLLANTLLVRRILQLHISPAVLTAEGDLFDGRELATFDFGNTITVDFAR